MYWSRKGETVGINTIVGHISDGAAAPAPAPAQVAAPPPPPPAPVAAPAPAAPVYAAPAPAAAAPAIDEGWSFVAAGAQDGAREQYRFEQCSRYWRRWPDHETGPGSVHGGRCCSCRSGHTLLPLRCRLRLPPPPPPPPAPMQVAVAQPVNAPPPPPPAPAREPMQMPGAAAAHKVEPMSNMRKKIAEHMVFSKHHLGARHHRPQSGHDEHRRKLRNKMKASVPDAIWPWPDIHAAIAPGPA